MKHITNFLSLFICLIGPLSFAQEDKKTWQIRVVAMDIVNEMSSLWLSNGPGAEPLEVPLNIWTFSKVIEYKGDENLAFYSTAANASAEEPPKPVAKIKLKDKGSILVFAASQQKGEYQAFAIGEKNFPFGSFRLVNFSKIPVLAKFADEKLSIQPGASELVAFKVDEPSIDVTMYAKQDKGEPRIIRESRWSIVPNQRELVLLLPNPRNGLIQFRHFLDTKEN